MNIQLTQSQKDIKDEVINLFEKYVPAYGKSKTTSGEMIRACNHILHCWSNDGEMIGSGYGNLTCNPACRYLKEQCARFGIHCDIFEMLPGSFSRTYAIENTYSSILFRDIRKIVNLLNNHHELFTEKNDKDMVDYLMAIDIDEEYHDSEGYVLYDE